MKQKNIEKWQRVIIKGKRNYVIKYGVLGWGLTSSVCIRVWNYLDVKPINIATFLLESIPLVITFMLSGILFGLFNFNYLKNKISDYQSIQK